MLRLGMLGLKREEIFEDSDEVSHEDIFMSDTNPDFSHSSWY